MLEQTAIVIEAPKPVREISFEAKVAIDTILRRLDLMDMVDNLAEEADKLVLN